MIRSPERSYQLVSEPADSQEWKATTPPLSIVDELSGQIRDLVSDLEAKLAAWMHRNSEVCSVKIDDAPMDLNSEVSSIKIDDPPILLQHIGIPASSIVEKSRLFQSSKRRSLHRRRQLLQRRFPHLRRRVGRKVKFRFIFSSIIVGGRRCAHKAIQRRVVLVQRQLRRCDDKVPCLIVCSALRVGDRQLRGNQKICIFKVLNWKFDLQSRISNSLKSKCSKVKVFSGKSLLMVNSAEFFFELAMIIMTMSFNSILPLRLCWDPGGQITVMSFRVAEMFGLVLFGTARYESLISWTNCVMTLIAIVQYWISVYFVWSWSSLEMKIFSYNGCKKAMSFDKWRAIFGVMHRDLKLENFLLVNEDDMICELWKKRSGGLSLVQHGYWQPDQSFCYQAMIKATQGTYNNTVSQAEICFWEEHWLNCACQLSQWDTLVDFGKSVENYELHLDCLREISDWIYLKENVLSKAQVDKTPKLQLIQAFFSLHDRNASGVADAESMVQKGIELTFEQWWQLPELSIQSCVPLLQQSQQLVEFQESARVLLDVDNGSKQLSAVFMHPELKDIYEKHIGEKGAFQMTGNGIDQMIGQKESDDERVLIQSSIDLAGVKIFHELDKVLEGGTVVLTLKDQNILANGDVNEEADKLVNVEIEEKKLKNKSWEEETKLKSASLEAVMLDNNSLTNAILLLHNEVNVLTDKISSFVSENLDMKEAKQASQASLENEIAELHKDLENVKIKNCNIISEKEASEAFWKKQDDAVCQAILEKLDSPLISTSIKWYKEDEWMIDHGIIAVIYDPEGLEFVLNGGIRVVDPSIVVDMTGDAPKFIRQEKEPKQDWMIVDNANSNSNSEDYLEFPFALLNQKEDGKKLLLITNSDYVYTNKMMQHAFNRFLPNDMNWHDLFDKVIVYARKPEFFQMSQPMYEVVIDKGLTLPCFKVRSSGFYSCGSALMIEQSLNIQGDEILYVGNHIYTDFSKSKVYLWWRTTLICRELQEEFAFLIQGRAQRVAFIELISQKEIFGDLFNQLRLVSQRRVNRRPAQTRAAKTKGWRVGLV